MRRREAEIDQQRARGQPVGKGSTLAELLGWYGKDIKALTPWGRSKEADLKRLLERPAANAISGGKYSVQTSETQSA